MESFFVPLGRIDHVVSGVANEAETMIIPFQHVPLDHAQASIRLLRILPDLSVDGLIQGQIWHDDINARYTCLSYVWGSEEGSQTILLNDCHFSVRKNLFDFLGIAQTKYANAERTFWIDALSIDQSSIMERNHQVGQMGSIYAQADEVIGWLGLSRGVERALRFCVEISTFMPRTEGDAWRLWLARRSSIIEDWRELQTHHYWERAWITQEIMCARRMKLLVGNFETDPARFTVISMLLPEINVTPKKLGVLHAEWTTNTKLFNTYLEAMCGKRRITNSRLVELLHELPRRESQIPRDRLYSLFSIASDMDSFLIDYASLEKDVLLYVLQHLRSSMCLCLYAYVANTLEYSTKTNPLRVTVHQMPIFSLRLTPCLLPMSIDKMRGPVFGRHCIHCGGGPFSKIMTEGHVFCMKQLCNWSEKIHFYLLPHSTIQNREWRPRFEPLFQVYKVDIESPHDEQHTYDPAYAAISMVYNIQLTGDVLIQLIRSSTACAEANGSEYRHHVPLELCYTSRCSTGPLSFHLAQVPGLTAVPNATTYFIEPITEIRAPWWL